MRPDRDMINLAICKVISLRANCQRGRVGCIITKNKRIVSSGYNGPLIGKDCSEANCDLSQKCQHAVHAEANAIAAASREGISLQGSTLYCTHGPCYECAKLIIQSGIYEVFYVEAYKNEEGINLLKQSDVTVIKVIFTLPHSLYDEIQNYKY